VGTGRVGWIRRTQAVTLLCAALGMSLVFGVAVLVVVHGEAARRDGADHPAVAMSDGESAAQVVGAATRIVRVAGLHNPAGGYIFVSCRNEHDPPYQAAVYLSFALPQGNSVRYLREVAEAMAADGWRPAASVDEHFGEKLTAHGLTAVFYRNPDDPRSATMRIYGECRNMSDHRSDNPAWTELTDRLAG
jgi:hypothetical protein